MAILKGIKETIDVDVEAVCAFDRGTVVKVPFVVTFKRPSKRQARKELIDLIYGYESDEQEKDENGKPIFVAGLPKYVFVESTLTEQERYTECVLGWRDLLDQEGNAIPFTPENLQLLVDTPDYTAALWDGLLFAYKSGKQVLEKNS
jgi:hypothetical protein